MGKPWWEASTADAAEGAKNLGGKVGDFLSGWGRDRVDDAKRDLGIRDPNNRRDPISEARRAAAEGRWDDYDNISKGIDPGSLSLQEKQEFSGYGRKARSSAEERELQKQGKTYDQLYGDKGFVTQTENRRFARDMAFARDQAKTQKELAGMGIAGQRDVANINAGAGVSIAGINADAARDVANISGSWGFKSTDRNAEASEGIAGATNATNLVTSLANTEMNRDNNHLQHKAQRSKMLLDTWLGDRELASRGYSPVNYYNPFK